MAQTLLMAGSPRWDAAGRDVRPVLGLSSSGTSGADFPRPWTCADTCAAFRKCRLLLAFPALVAL